MKQTSPTSHAAEPTVKVIWKDALWGMAFVMLMVTLKLAFEHAPIQLPGQIETLTESLLQGRLQNYKQGADLNAVVVDLQSIPPQRLNEETDTLVTPRDKLLESLKVIAAAKPDCIAVDVDFSPDRGVTKHSDDAKFFQQCLQLSQETGVPVFLGVWDARHEAPENWLSGGEFIPMAAGMAVPPDVFRVHQWLATENSKQKLPSFSRRLAEARGESAPPVPEFWSWAVEVEHRRKFRVGKHDMETAEIIGDFSPLQRLIDTTIHTMRPEALADWKDKIDGKMVLVGDALDAASDKFELPGIYDEPVSGVYIHACGALTPEHGYLWQLTHTGRLSMDALVAGLVLLGVALTRICLLRCNDKRSLNLAFLNRLLNFGAALVIVLIAVVLVRELRLFWTDFILVCVSLLIHEPMHHFLGDGRRAFLRWLERKMFIKTNQTRI